MSLKIIKHGTITHNTDGTVTLVGFVFDGDFDGPIELTDIPRLINEACDRDPKCTVTEAWNRAFPENGLRP